MDFDETRLYYSHQQLQVQSEEPDDNPPETDDDDNVDLAAVRRHFREFLRKSKSAALRSLLHHLTLPFHRQLSSRTTPLSLS